MEPLLLQRRRIQVSGMPRPVVLLALYRASDAEQRTPGLTDDSSLAISSSACLPPATACDDLAEDAVVPLSSIVPSEALLSRADSLSLQLWDAAEILTKYLLDNRDLWTCARSCLELGSGVGLCGLAMSQFLPTVVLSDNDPIALQLLAANLTLNAQRGIPGAAAPVLPPCGGGSENTFRVVSPAVLELDWSLAAGCRGCGGSGSGSGGGSGSGSGSGTGSGGNCAVGAFDMVVGADVSYSTSATRALVRCAARHLARSSQARIFVCHVVRLAVLPTGLKEASDSVLGALLETAADEGLVKLATDTVDFGQSAVPAGGESVLVLVFGWPQ
eukprot:gnl/Hemi2/28522_TR9443_c0_g1_i1.p2 gnl/Hemi2/28522_TR9443_c0_g1~~gnl/Hemi2/28522_TR9443_c0_g1_i1.p2  ORF type:complete len:330 (-),score=71.43 gnl/Hemi2/28522_TR9443_c0_g1_i1:58-1047(-)